MRVGSMSGTIPSGVAPRMAFKAAGSRIGTTSRVKPAAAAEATAFLPSSVDQFRSQQKEWMLSGFKTATFRRELGAGAPVLRGTGGPADLVAVRPASQDPLVLRRKAPVRSRPIAGLASVLRLEFRDGAGRAYAH